MDREMLKSSAVPLVFFCLLAADAFAQAPSRPDSALHPVRRERQGAPLFATAVRKTAMDASAALRRTVPAGQVIQPWLVLGPVYRDVSAEVIGLSLHESNGADNGLSVLNRFVEGADGLLTSSPREGETASFAGQEFRWDLVRRPEPVLRWGRYNLSNHFGAVLLATRVRSAKKARQHFELLTRISSRARVFVNGAPVFDTETAAGRRAAGLFSFDADLEAGDNLLTVGLFRVGRMAQVNIRLTCDGDLDVSTPLPGGVSQEEREAVEADLRALRLERDIFYKDHPIGVKLDCPLTSKANLTCRLMRGSEAIKTMRLQPQVAGLFALCRGSDLTEGGYELACDFTDDGGRLITSTSFNLTVFTLTPPTVGYGKMEARRRATLEHNAAPPPEDRSVDARLGFVQLQVHDIWRQVATYALGRYDRIDEEVIRYACDFIARRQDTSDFVIQAILRLLYWDRTKNRLSQPIKARMRDTVLGFRYWADEPGDDVMYMGSENHRLLFHVAEFLSGQLFPLDEFTNSRQRGLYHVTKARMFLMEWLRQRGRFGFDEWHSNSYYPANIAALLNLHDFAQPEDIKLRKLTRNVLHYLFFNLAADTFHGVFGTAHARSYAVNLIHPDTEWTSATCWLLFGEGNLDGGAGMAPVCLASSGYVLPELIARIAEDRETVAESRQQQGTLEGPVPSANFVVYRTPDYLMSGVQDYRRPEYDSSSNVAQVTFDDKTVVFFSCPHTSGEGAGFRPDYWSGNAVLPRVIQRRNVTSLTWRLTEDAWMTHAFFEPDRFDEVRFEGNWAFARKNRGYLGIWSENGLTLGNSGQYAGRELICPAKENTWIVECGREADWKSFDAFVAALKSAAVRSDRGRVAYDSPSIGRFVTGWDIPPTVAGEPVQTRDYGLVESPFALSAYGSGEMVLRHGDERLRLFFNF